MVRRAVSTRHIEWKGMPLASVAILSQTMSTLHAWYGKGEVRSVSDLPQRRNRDFQVSAPAPLALVGPTAAASARRMRLHERRRENDPNASKEKNVKHSFMLIAIGAALGIGGLLFAQHEGSGENVKVLSVTNLKEKLDGKEATATAVEVTIEPGKAGVPHRHPGSAIGYVVEGEYELGIDEQPTKVIKAGETFYEPNGCLHRVSRNPGKVRTRLIAVVLHPRDAKEIAVPESRKD